MKEKIKPCPFCGGYPHIYMKTESDYYAFGKLSTREKLYHVRCSQCGGTSGEYLYKEYAIEAWNRRLKDETEVQMGK